MSKKLKAKKLKPLNKILASRYLILIILLLALVLRLYHFSHPLADWHSFRQVDTASVTREYVKAGQIKLGQPRYHDLSNIQSGLENPEGYRMVEWPFINGLIAEFLLLTARLGINLDLVQVSRAFAIVSSLLAIYALYRLINLLADRRTALLSAFIYAVLPYAIFYGRVVLPEPFMMALSLLSLWQWAVFCHKKSQNQRAAWAYWLSAVSLALAALLKPTIFFLLPLYLALTWQLLGKKMWRQLGLYFYPLLVLLPLVVWRVWISQFPAGIPVSQWLLNGNGIRLRPAWFRWLFYERLTKLFFGYTGLILLLANLKHQDKLRLIFWSWWTSIVIYFVVVATGNVQHDYYQNLAIPIVALSLARGMTALPTWLKQLKLHQSQQWATMLSILILVSSLFLSGRQIIGYFNVNRWDYVGAGQAVDRLTDPDALVIAPAMGDTIFLFQTNRRGWPIGFNIQGKIDQGASIYVSVNDDDERRQLETNYQIIEKTDRYSIIDLSQAKP